MGAGSDLRNFECLRNPEKKEISKARCRNKSRGSTTNGGSVKGWARRWAHADFGEGRGSHGEFWREVRGNTQQNLLLHGCYRTNLPLFILS